MKIGTRFEILQHCKTENTGQIRVVSYTDTTGFYSKVENEPAHKLSVANGGKGSFCDFGKSSQWVFGETVRTIDHSGNIIIEFKILEED
jgi:hypothetical protein